MQWLVLGLTTVIVLVLLLNGLSSAIEQERDMFIPDRVADDVCLVPCELCGREAEHYCDIHGEWFCDADWPWHVDVCMAPVVVPAPVYEWNGLEGRRIC